MAKICELTGVGPRKGSIIWRSGKSKKSGGIPQGLELALVLRADRARGRRRGSGAGERRRELRGHRVALGGLRVGEVLLLARVALQVVQLEGVL